MSRAERRAERERKHLRAVQDEVWHLISRTSAGIGGSMRALNLEEVEGLREHHNLLLAAEYDLQHNTRAHYHGDPSRTRFYPETWRTYAWDKEKEVIILTHGNYDEYGHHVVIEKNKEVDPKDVGLYWDIKASQKPPRITVGGGEVAALRAKLNTGEQARLDKERLERKVTREGLTVEEYRNKYAGRDVFM